MHVANALSFYFVAGKTKRLENLECHPRPAVVQTKPMFYPYFVSLHRCNGSKGTHPPSKFRCVPKTTKDVPVVVFNSNGGKVLVMKNHTECQTECTITRDSCKYPNVYDPAACSCKCHHSFPPSSFGSCGPNKTWSSIRCGCQCKQRVNCSRKYMFDEETCSCKCKPKRKQNCESMNGIFKPETCGCRKAQRQLSPGDVKGSFVGSTAFWVYILIGEFVLLLICFDVILYFKHMGAIYSIVRKCRTTPANVKEEEVEANVESQTLKAHYNDVCDSAFSSLQDISRTDLPSVAPKVRRL